MLEEIGGVGGGGEGGMHELVEARLGDGVGDAVHYNSFDAGIT